MNQTILYKQIAALLEESNKIAALSNVTACINNSLDRINWVGFYFFENGELVLGPFQGNVACTHIQVGKGVCGMSIQNKKAILVEDVHQFPGHIACDSASNSELVIPLLHNDFIYGVLDIDSPEYSRFTEEHLKEFETISCLIAQTITEKKWMI